VHPASSGLTQARWQIKKQLKVIVAEAAAHFYGHFPQKACLTSCFLDSQSAVLLILSIFTGQAIALHPHRLPWAVHLHKLP